MRVLRGLKWGSLSPRWWSQGYRVIQGGAGASSRTWGDGRGIIYCESNKLMFLLTNTFLIHRNTNGFSLLIEVPGRMVPKRKLLQDREHPNDLYVSDRLTARPELRERDCTEAIIDPAAEPRDAVDPA